MFATRKQRVGYALRCRPIKWPFKVIQSHLFFGTAKGDIVSLKDLIELKIAVFDLPSPHAATSTPPIQTIDIRRHL